MPVGFLTRMGGIKGNKETTTNCTIVKVVGRRTNQRFVLTVERNMDSPPPVVMVWHRDKQWRYRRFVGPVVTAEIWFETPLTGEEIALFRENPKMFIDTWEGETEDERA